MTEQKQQPKKSKYAATSGVKAQREGNYPRSGHYLVLVKGVREDSTWNNKDFVAAEFVNLHTFADSTPGRDYDRKAPDRLLSVEEEFSEVFMTGNTAFAQRIKSFAMALANMSEDEYNAAEEYPGQGIDDIVGEHQPGAGVVLEMTVKQAVSKDNRAKTDEQMQNKDTYHKVFYKRASFADAKRMVDPAVAARLLPDLDKQVAEEAKG